MSNLYLSSSVRGTYAVLIQSYVYLAKIQRDIPRNTEIFEIGHSKIRIIDYISPFSCLHTFAFAKDFFNHLPAVLCAPCNRF